MNKESMPNQEKPIYIVPRSEVGWSLDPRRLEESVGELTLGPVGRELRSAASSHPTTPEDEFSTNILVWTNEIDHDNPIGLQEISPSALWSMSEYALALLDEYPDSAVTYGISEDPRGITGHTRKALGTSVQAFHLHNYVNLRKDIQPAPSGKYRSLREPFPDHVAALFTQYLKHRGIDFQGFRSVDPELKDGVLNPYLNFGGIVYASTDNARDSLRVAHFADAMAEIHEAYYAFHEQLMRIFFSNFEAVRDSKWTIAYIPRNHTEIVEAINETAFIRDRTLADFLIRAAARIGRSDDDALSADLKIFRSPTYSVGAAKNSGGVLCFVVNPHFYAQRAGGLQALGIEVPERLRREDMDPYDLISGRTARAREAHLNIKKSIQETPATINVASGISHIPLAGRPVEILNTQLTTLDPATEWLIAQEVQRIVAKKRANLPPGTAFYDGPAFFPHTAEWCNVAGNFLIKGAHYPQNGYFRHVALRDSDLLRRDLRERNIIANAGLAVSILVEVQFDDGSRRIVLTTSAPTEYEPNGKLQIAGGSYQPTSKRIRLPNPVFVAQQELAEELGLQLSEENIRPLTYLPGDGNTNPTLVYIAALNQRRYYQMVDNSLSRPSDALQMPVDNDRAKEFVLVDPAGAIPESITKGARRVLEVYREM